MRLPVREVWQVRRHLPLPPRPRPHPLLVDDGLHLVHPAKPARRGVRNPRTLSAGRRRSPHRMPPRNVGKDSEPGSQAVAGIVSSTCEICDSRTAVGGQPQPSIRPLGAKPSPRRGLAGPRDRRGRKGGGRGGPAGRGSRSGPGPLRALEPSPPRGARGRRRGRTLAATVTSGIVSRFVCSMAGSPRYPVGEYSILRPLYSTCTLLPPAPPGPAAAAPGAGREPAVRQRVRFAEFCCCCCAHPGGGEGLDAPGGGGAPARPPDLQESGTRKRFPRAFFFPLWFQPCP